MLGEYLQNVLVKQMNMTILNVAQILLDTHPTLICAVQRIQQHEAG
jgi:hypothetical protein